MRSYGYTKENPKVASFILSDALKLGRVPDDVRSPYREVVQLLLDHWYEIGYA
jgi:hypothetical protein